jgi:hypothetical protein
MQNETMDNQIYSPLITIPLALTPFLADWLPFVHEAVQVLGVLISGGWLAFALYKYFKKQK